MDSAVSLRTFLLYSSRFFLNSTLASIFAGESMLGSFSIEITDTSTASTPRMGLQRSSAVSCVLKLSVPGGWRIEMQTFPSG